MAMHECRSFAGPAMLHRLAQYSVRLHRISAIALCKVKVGKVCNQPGDVPTGSINFHRHGNRILVVFHEEEHRQLQIGSTVDRLPEFTLARGAIATGDVYNLIAVED